jgi:hypothetical protein
MKRLMFLLVVVVLLSVTLSACVDKNEASKFCKANDDLGLTHGKCVSAITAGVAKGCQEYWEVAGFKSQGDCVSTINAYLKENAP